MGNVSNLYSLILESILRYQCSRYLELTMSVNRIKCCFYLLYAYFVISYNKQEGHEAQNRSPE